MKRFCAKLLALGLTVSSVLGGIYTALPMSIAYATEVTDNTESGETATDIIHLPGLYLSYHNQGKCQRKMRALAGHA